MPNDNLAISDFKELKSVSNAMAKSGYFNDARSASKAMAKIMFGQELDVGPAASMANIHIIQGKPSIGSHLIASKVKSSEKYDYRLKSKSDKECVVEWYEDGEKVGESDFTYEQAEDIGLTSKDNWQNYPENMLFARAISNGAKFYCPDVFITGVYTPDEMESVDEPTEAKTQTQEVGEDDFELVDQGDDDSEAFDGDTGEFDASQVTHDPDEEVPLDKADGKTWRYLDQGFLEWIIDNFDPGDMLAKAIQENDRREEEDDYPVPATDAARELADEHGISLNDCERSGANDNVLKSDVEAMVEDDGEVDDTEESDVDNEVDDDYSERIDNAFAQLDEVIPDTDVTMDIAIDTVGKFTTFDTDGVNELSDINTDTANDKDFNNVKAMFTLIQSIESGDKELEIDEDNALKGMIPF